MLSFEPSNIAPYNIFAAIGHTGFGIYLIDEMFAKELAPKFNPI
jgi:hypothetical protein